MDHIASKASNERLFLPCRIHILHPHPAIPFRSSAPHNIHPSHTYNNIQHGGANWPTCMETSLLRPTATYMPRPRRYGCYYTTQRGNRCCDGWTLISTCGGIFDSVSSCQWHAYRQIGISSGRGMTYGRRLRRTRD